ncbi:hypothetical protein [Propionimicrobium sp. PCR01-08-3]|uniref:hypothetical protein n=1 Tax=Propionimicrobium sp. PCR01-08-3 TaxID=3052086 RepID=UPI00255CB54B|nr:hypothetical protein [Propionimicrobium sp. PCR01-08-3]WIY84314.1 hypothetical protein QQ658_15245 [Propionimicrobium sp. PCR01-08-3]
MSKLRVYKQGVAIIVIGTQDTYEACLAAGLSPEIHRWGSTEWGMYARRKYGWTAYDNDQHPKDARPGVRFNGPVRARDDAEVHR